MRIGGHGFGLDLTEGVLKAREVSDTVMARVRKAVGL